MNVSFLFKSSAKMAKSEHIYSSSNRGIYFGIEFVEFLQYLSLFYLILLTSIPFSGDVFQINEWIFCRGESKHFSPNESIKELNFMSVHFMEVVFLSSVEIVL